MNPQASNEITADQILQQINELPISLNAAPIPAAAIQPGVAQQSWLSKYGLYVIGGLVLMAIVTKH